MTIVGALGDEPPTTIKVDRAIVSTPTPSSAQKSRFLSGRDFFCLRADTLSGRPTKKRRRAGARRQWTGQA
jgi:hypothetical protein